MEPQPGANHVDLEEVFPEREANTDVWDSWAEGESTVVWLKHHLIVGGSKNSTKAKECKVQTGEDTFKDKRLSFSFFLSFFFLTLYLQRKYHKQEKKNNTVG